MIAGLLNGSNYSFTTSANKYLNESAGKLAFNYFIDVVFCGSESYFDTIKQGVQDGYFAVTGQGGKVGSENMLMKQDKALLVEYLTKIMELPDEQTKTEVILETFMDSVDNSLDFYDTIEGVMQLAKQDTDYAISDDLVKVLTDIKLKKIVDAERLEIRRLQSDLDIARRTAARNRTLTPEMISNFASRQREISKRQSDIDTDVFKNAHSPEITNRYKNISDKISFGFDVATVAYSRISQFTELIKYSQKLAAFEQYREFITELSHCDYDYVAVAAEQLLKDLNSKERSDYAGRGTYEFFMGTLSDTRLNNEGYRTSRGALFNKNSLRYILKNEKYIGIYAFKDIRDEGVIPPIVSRELFDQCQEKLAEHHRSPAADRETSFLLTTKLFCGHCGEPMTGDGGTSHSGKVYYYYTCNNRKKHKCDKERAPKDWIERLVIDELVQLIHSDSFINEVADRCMEFQQREKDQSTLHALEARQKENEKAIQNMIAAIEAGIITPSTKSRLVELEAEKVRIETGIAQQLIEEPELERDQVVYFLERFRNGDENDEAYRQLLVGVFLNAVYLYDDKITLVLNYTGENCKVTLELVNNATNCADPDCSSFA